MAMAMEEAIVLYPSPGMGHLISMVELAKLILHHRPSISPTILLTEFPSSTNTASYIASVSSAVPSITFHHLPPIPQDPSAYSSIEHMLCHLLQLNTTHVDAALRSIALTNVAITALVIDLFCFPAMEVASNIGIPVYTFFTSGAGCLVVDLHLPHLHKTITQNFKDLDYPVDFPSLPPIPLNQMPDAALVRGTQVYNLFIDTVAHLSKTTGILINTFESLEPDSVKALSDGLQIPDCPPVFCIGPLIATNAKKIDDSGAECLRWLDLQPKQSVVYLCFGSMGLFSKHQLREIAVGLERSGQRFLWVVRNPPPEQEQQKTVGFLSVRPDLDLESLLPEGFLGRTRDRGFVAKTWVPQVEVLSHDSVGGFVTHCGWNSVLEAVRGGVAMVAWPLYAEQKINKVILTEVLKLAVAVEVPESGLVNGEEVEKRVREVMESEALRSGARAKKQEAVAALTEGGSSHIAMRIFIHYLFSHREASNPTSHLT